MEYTKSPISILEQIERLKNRGLFFSDEKMAEKYLSKSKNRKRFLEYFS